MKLTMQQKALAVVACLGVGAVAVDRLVLSGGVSGPNAAAADSPRNATKTAGSKDSAGPVNTKVETSHETAPLTDHAALSRTLDQLAGNLSMHSDALSTAFEVPAAWRQSAQRSAANRGSSQKNAPASTEEDRSGQGRSLRLEAVLADRNGEKVAIVGGQLLRIGERIGAYTLVRINERSATFRKADRLVKLKISDD